MKGKMRWRNLIRPIDKIELREGQVWFTAVFPPKEWMKTGRYQFSIIGPDKKTVVTYMSSLTVADSLMDRWTSTVTIELPVRLHPESE